MKEAYIYDSIRSPRGRGKPDGSLHELSAVSLSAKMLNILRKRNSFDSKIIEDVIWGNVTQIGEQGGCLARSSVLYAGYDKSVPGLSINRFCASGLEAVNLASNQIKGGAGIGYIAGGVEMMSRVPMGSDGAAIAVDPELAMKTYFVPQGISADIIATKYGFSRNDVDSYAVESQNRASKAWKESRFKKSITQINDQNGIEILSKDEYLRPDTNMQSLASLSPSFKQMGEEMPGFDSVAKLKYPDIGTIDHVHHAGNSSGIVDGSAAMLIGSKELGELLGVRPRAQIIASEKIGTDPTIMLTGPVPATKKIIKSVGLEINDIDLFEVNEAFASVVLMFMEVFKVEQQSKYQWRSNCLGTSIRSNWNNDIRNITRRIRTFQQGNWFSNIVCRIGHGSSNHN
jgi:acetyl-CoA C-acetyltransferase